MTDEGRSNGLGDAGPTAQVVPPRTAIVLMGAGCGFFAGLVGGGFLGGVLGLAGALEMSDATWLFPIAFWGGVGGSMVGLATGIISGVVFASSAPRLARQAATE